MNRRAVRRLFAPVAELLETRQLLSVPVLGDFDGDGKQDIAVTNAFDGTVLVLRGDGAGAFAAAQSFTAGTSPEALAVGDFNGDSHTDLAIGNRSSNNVSFFLGSTATTLGTPVTINTATDPATLATGDFNHDGFLDLLVGASGGSSASSGALQVFTGDGAGVLSTTPINTLGPRGVTAVADINRDGFPDTIVGVTTKNTADALLNNGDGTFTLTKGSTGKSGVKAAVAGDMNEDGKTDIVSAVAGTIDVLALQDNGTFAKAVGFDAAGGQGPAVADVNGDGRADVLTVTSTPGETSRRTLNVSIANRLGPDFSVEITSALPTTVVTSAGSQAVVRVTNHGNETFRGQPSIELYASLDSTVDSGDVLLRQVLPKLKLGIGKGKNLKLKFVWPGTAGDYHLIARVDPSHATGDLNTFDNSAITTGTVNVASAFIDLAGAFSAVPTVVRQTKSTSAVLELSTLGNVNSAGVVTIRFHASTDSTLDSLDPAVAVFQKKVKLTVGKPTRIKIKFKASSVVPGIYYLLANINPDGVIAESSLDNNLVVSGTQFTVLE